MIKSFMKSTKVHNKIDVFITTTLVLFLIPLNCIKAIDNSSERGKLLVRITGFENNKGDCWFALDRLEEVYESDDSVFIGKILPIINREVIISIDSLEYGNYAIKVFHDENSNGELDSNILGIPTEGYGFSNNASSWFGPPSWEKAKFLIDQKEVILEILVD